MDYKARRLAVITELAAQGKHLSEIADAVFMSHTSLAALVRKHGIVVQPKASPKFLRNKAICDEYSQTGASSIWLARKYGISRERVCQILRRANLIDLKYERRRLAREQIAAEIAEQRAAVRAKIDEAIAMIHGGCSINEVSRRTGVTVGVLRTKAKGLSQHGRWRDWSARKNRYLQLRSSGLSMARSIEIMRAEGERINKSWIAHNFPNVHPNRGDPLPVAPDLKDYPS
jgi:hypothetical protein